MQELPKINLDQPAASVPADQLPVTKIAPMPKSQSKASLIIVIVAVVLGAGTGWFLAQKRLLLAGSTPAGSTLAQNPTDSGSVRVGDVFGSSDEQTFRDNAEGVLTQGGIDGEGSHHLERGADKSQWVYLTSSVVDLDLFIGHRVEVWGETFQSKKAGWLMDVGRLKVIELNAATESEAMQEE